MAEEGSLSRERQLDVLTRAHSAATGRTRDDLAEWIRILSRASTCSVCRMPYPRPKMPFRDNLFEKKQEG
jgi:hypothetical protein